MLKKQINPKGLVDFLNSQLLVDPIAIGALFGVRVPCNAHLRDHPTTQVGCEENFCQVGIIGVLNGLFGTYEAGHGCISIEVADGVLKRFGLLDENGKTLK